jgi:hypothetical protein
LDLGSTNASLEMINKQIWATTSLLSNSWRHGTIGSVQEIPELTPVNFPGNFASGQIPRRQPILLVNLQPMKNH